MTEPTIFADITERELHMVIRSAAHALADAVTPDAVKFRHNVTDLDAARLMLRLERGALIVPAGRAWHDLGGRGFPHLTRTVNECLRLGLVEAPTRFTSASTTITTLTPAPVHLRAGVNTTACPASALYPGVRRRTVDIPELVDCAACLRQND